MSTGLTPEAQPRMPDSFDAYTGTPVPTIQPGQGVMEKLLSLHRELFAGLP
jgi:hypothetical protein